MDQECFLRSLFFVPGHVDKYLSKAKELRSDAIILDLEDSVPFVKKEDALKKVSQFIVKEGALQSRIIVRINEIDDGRVLKELGDIVHQNLYAIMPSKIEEESDIEFLDRILFQIEKSRGMVVGGIKILPLIESLSAFINVAAISRASQRMIGLAFGGEDYLQELGGAHGAGDHTFDYPRTKIAIAAKASGLQAIDTPFLDVSNHEGFKHREQKSRDLGYEGCLVIHPSQIGSANECFSPTEEEVSNARSILQAVKQSQSEGLSVVLRDGVLVGPPMVKKALKIINKANALKDED